MGRRLGEVGDGRGVVSGFMLLGLCHSSLEDFE
jgi:hypothetical protein